MNDRNPREDLNKAFPNHPISENLRMRVTVLSNTNLRMQAFLTPKRIALMTSAAGILAIGFLLLAPMKASASFADVMESIDGAKTARLTFTSADGQPSRAIYYMAGKWRIEEGSEIVNVYDHTVAARYVQSQNVTYVMKCKGPFSTPIESFKISSILKARPGGTVPRPKQVDDNGREANLYTVVSGKEKQDFFVDPSTELPYRCDLSYQGLNGWNGQGSIKMEFNIPLDPGLFKLSMVRKIVNVDDAKLAFLKKLATTRLGATKTYNGECVIRDVQVNSSGDVFILYTASGLPTNQVINPLTINDNLGTYYEEIGEFMPETKLPNGEWLRIQWFTPVSEESTFTPKSLRVSISKYGGQLWDANRPTSWKPSDRIPKDAKMVTQDMMDPAYDEQIQTVYTVRIENPPFSGIPSYAALIDYANLTGLSFEMNKKHARAKYWAAKQDWPKAEAAYRATIEAVKKLQTSCGRSYVMTEFYDGLATSLGKQGKTEEAASLRAMGDQWRSPNPMAAVPARDVYRKR